MRFSLELSRRSAPSFEASRLANAAAPGHRTWPVGGDLFKPNPAVNAVTVQMIKDVQELNHRMSRAYSAAMTDQYNTDFPGTHGSANTEIFPHLYKVRTRTRTLAKDTCHGKAIVRTFKSNVVGADPFRLDMRVGKYTKTEGKTVFEEEEETNRLIEKQWKRFLRPENFTVRKNMTAMEALCVMESEAITAGSLIVRHKRGFEFNEFGYAIDLQSSDRLQETYNGLSPRDGLFGGGNPIRASVEYHPDHNFPLAYWILTRQPNEFFFQTPSSDGNVKVWRQQIPAADVIHFNNLRDRAEQDWGMTELDAATQPLWRNHQYDKSLTIAAIGSCIRAFVLEKKLPTGIQMPTELVEQMMAGGSGSHGGDATGSLDKAPGIPGDPVKSQQGVGIPAQTQMPGQREELPFGVEAKVLAPEFPSEPAHEFRQDNLRDIAVSVGIRYQDISGDFQNLGFAAALMCGTPMQDYMKMRQKNMTEIVIRRIFREWLRCSILKGALDLSISRLEEFVDAATFKPKRWAFVNPLVQAQTLIIEMEAGIKSPQQVQDELADGVSIEDLYTMIAEAKVEQEKHGLDFSDADVTRPTISKGEPGQEVPKPGELDEGGAGAKPPKTKPGNPVRRRGIAPATMAIIAGSQNGIH